MTSSAKRPCCGSTAARCACMCEGLARPGLLAFADVWTVYVQAVTGEAACETRDQLYDHCTAQIKTATDERWRDAWTELQSGIHHPSSPDPLK